MSDSFFSHKETNIVKGIAINLMFFHHFFTIPDHWTEVTAQIYINNQFELWTNCFKICVPIFAFLTGYFYFFTKKKTLIYSIRKVTDLWISYVFVFLILIALGICFGVYQFSILKFIEELFALSLKTMVHCWYVWFYFFTMLLLPLYFKFSEKNDVLPFMFACTIPLALCFLLNISPLSSISPINKIIPAISGYIQYFYYFPLVAVGFVFAKHDFFSRMYKIIFTESVVARLFSSLLLIAVAFLSRGIFNYVDFISAPMFVFGLLVLVKQISVKWIFVPLSILGRYSLLLWFLHCAFADQLREITQPILYFPRNPILVTIWGLLICLVVAVIIKFPIDVVIKLKNNLLKSK